LPRPTRVALILHLDADFADIFDVRNRRLPPRPAVRRKFTTDGLVLSYRYREFSRALHVEISAPPPKVAFVGSRLTFDLELEHGTPWHCCVEARPEIEGRVAPFAGDAHQNEAEAPSPVRVTGAPALVGPFECACADLDALRIPSGDRQVVAAGVPWFQTLFGRDTLMASLMTGLTGSDDARGALRALGALQARQEDDWRDAQPGKLPHELRRGELAQRGLIPHTPYYGTHDAPSLYCLALWNAWRWTGDRSLLDDHFDTACAALGWTGVGGDLDGDGLQEYKTRSRDGYYNQGWKDAGDAIVDAEGHLGELPLATVELQGYLFAARLAMAELCDEIGDSDAASGLRASAAQLAVLVEQRFWLEREGFYAIALDGAKRQLTSISSNPGHLLWCGLPSRDRARIVATRLVQPDLSSGWGLRTLSADHPSFNPLSYQLGSVWPHDTVLAAAGLARYGHHDEAATLLAGIVDAACHFEGDRLPELFCGFERGEGPPVPYAEANVPQAWAAAAAVLTVQVFLGLVPDAPRQRCYLAPWLPDWLDGFGVRGIAIGDAQLDVRLSRSDDGVHVNAKATNGFEIVRDMPPAPLWGASMREASQMAMPATRPS
ncbi:MAG TPA: glycogen debranching N-terminal domain-containing protein, partial [Ilumatobacteraceae bacterium]|nr:glycogen debranching N-terminal domain-containing protein [Ilumatobacteraceae bacterium]